MRRPIVVALAVLGIVSAMVFVPGATRPVDGQETISEARSERERVRNEKAGAAAELDAAKADDASVAEALAAITDAVNAQELELQDAQRRRDVAVAVAADAQEEIELADAERVEIERELSSLAVEGFLDSSERSAPDFLFEAAGPTEALRQSTLLQLANLDAAELLERLRIVAEDREVAAAIAKAALAEAEAVSAQTQALLAELEQQQATQAALKAELEARVAGWKEKVAAFESEERELSDFIKNEQAKLAAPGTPSSAAPGTASGSGFQWPINAPVTSSYGYRVHPIFGTRRLHAGIDLGAASGSPIYASKSGTVISAGWQGGYGRTVVISHSGGLSTLYAHQSSLAVSTGDSVDRGEVVGYVGSSGNSTGPHLHFEIRINGTATDPRPYLP